VLIFVLPGATVVSGACMRSVFLLAICLLLTAQLPAGEIATGSMLGPRYKSDRFYVRKTSTQWEETYRTNTYHRRAHGKLMAVSASQGLFEDEWLSERPFDADANTDALIAALDGYKSYGILAISVSLQGADPGYEAERNGIGRRSGAVYGKKEGSLVSAFEPDGSLKPAWTARLDRLLRAANSRGMFVKLTYFHAAQDEVFNGPKDIVAAAHNATRWLTEGDHRNVIIDIAEDWDVRGEWDHSDFISRNVANLISEVRDQFNGASFSLPIGASSGPSMLYPESLAQVCDVVMLDSSGLNSDAAARKLAQMSGYDRPLWVSTIAGEETQPSVPSLLTRAGWMHNPQRLTQFFPFSYAPSSDQQGARDLDALLHHIASIVLKKPPLDDGTD
jgi:hypothetical protein